MAEAGAGEGGGGVGPGYQYAEPYFAVRVSWAPSPIINDAEYYFRVQCAAMLTGVAPVTADYTWAAFIHSSATSLVYYPRYHISPGHWVINGWNQVATYDLWFEVALVRKADHVVISTEYSAAPYTVTLGTCKGAPPV